MKMKSTVGVKSMNMVATVRMRYVRILKRKKTANKTENIDGKTDD